jgi:hypothetical protein
VPLPTSFARDGFLPPSAVRGKVRHLLVGTDGWPNTGKTEFALSAPGPGIVLCLDRGFDGVLDNPRPPAARRDDFAYKVIQVPLPTQMAQPEYLDYWRAFYEQYKKALANPDARTVVLDGDSDSWELQRLAEFGKVTQVPPIAYANVNAARRAMIARAWDSGKIVISTNKLKEGYESQLDSNKKEVRLKTGKDARQGFPDMGYLYQVQLRHLYNKDDNSFGIRILACKSDTSLTGLELWGEDCNFKSLVQTIYPQVPLKEWGYERD